jgi:pSer/pThr/pTyr-binding forkhead associated (FHA) protein
MFLYSRTQSWALDEGSKALTIGRDKSNKIVIVSFYVSKFHAEIGYQKNILIIRDLNSRNGIYVNGKKADVVVLKDGDKIQIGHSVFWISDNETDLLESWKDRIKVYLVRKSRLLKICLAILPMLIIVEERFFGQLEILLRTLLDMIGLL